ncbi:hypothetical protein [Streptomyces erythrochromogenes]|uniref:hypothetical protein n=1 Tax=Streptomyces erythrochromogenes TaxID=285574 RepID=UPI00368642F8
MEAGEDEGLVPVAREGVGAGAGDGVQSVDVGADGLAEAAPLAGLQQLDLQSGQRLAGRGLVVAADGNTALAQADDDGGEVGFGGARGVSRPVLPALAQHPGDQRAARPLPRSAPGRRAS